MALIGTTKYGLRYPDLAQAADLAFLLQTLAQDMDAAMVGFGIGTHAARPGAGKAGKLYYETDTATAFMDDGAVWQVIGASNRVGLLAARPAANTVAVGTEYFATDQVVKYISDGAAWIRISNPAGTTVDFFNAVAPAGWVKYDGTNLGGSGGIYADLYAHLGNTIVTPDTRGRVLVGQGTHADVSAIQNNDGLAVGSRRPKHKTSIVDPGHVHPVHVSSQSNSGTAKVAGSDAGAATEGDVPGAGVSAVTGITAGPQTGSEPTDSAAYIVSLKIAKL